MQSRTEWMKKVNIKTEVHSNSTNFKLQFLCTEHVKRYVTSLCNRRTQFKYFCTLTNRYRIKNTILEIRIKEQVYMNPKQLSFSFKDISPRLQHTFYINANVENISHCMHKKTIPFMQWLHPSSPQHPEVVSSRCYSPQAYKHPY